MGSAGRNFQNFAGIKLRDKQITRTVKSQPIRIGQSGGKGAGAVSYTHLIAILIGGEAYGILGILLAVPVAGIVRVVYDRLFPADPESDRIVVAARADSGDVTQPGERAKTG